MASTIECAENTLYCECSNRFFIFHAFIFNDAYWNVCESQGSTEWKCLLANFVIIGSYRELFEATGLFVVVFSWFLSLMSNEFRQFLLAAKNNDVKDSFLTTTIAGNMVDLMSYLLFLIGFILHIASFYVYGDDYPQGPSVINPQFDDSEFSVYCPFYLPKLLVSAQECFRNLNTA